MKLSVITATYNAMMHLPNLVGSLRAQQDKDFEWVVADGASTDGTLEYLRSIEELNIKISSQEDFGIYDALNRAIKISEGDFYMIIGADDFLFSNAIKDYKDAIEDGVDIVTACIQVGKKISKAGKEGGKSRKKRFDYISGHAVGSIYRKNLHDRYGYYSKNYPIAADQLFVLSVCRDGRKVKVIDSLVGRFGLFGVSNTEKIGSATEYYRVLLSLGENKYLQTFLLFIRLIKLTFFTTNR